MLEAQLFPGEIDVVFVNPSGSACLLLNGTAESAAAESGNSTVGSVVPMVKAAHQESPETTNSP
jgi:hypothetical protein